ncbi:alpha-1,2-mannosidase [Streptomyces albus]|uniref:Alpha-1,2-mannosidase n=1 Tax=Streptomyces albus (strain ATCC 21838 / DSM 41398 / FERM P-419 / JCM 4703 / NBRC 107858) TaxID=1081613 RepID=A0A0B5EL84_STRA4|nr:alpha-1,2-mannosidase [Streptomyces albus]AOU77459.1 alpha-1,2-mannosidase [Streptomyces albus]AYN33232.1 alpha-mannosidase [Streptomyces albus]
MVSYRSTRPDTSPAPPGRPCRRLALTALAAAATALAAAGLTAPAATAATPSAPAAEKLTTDPVPYVDPLIGSANLGNTYPGAVVPFGMLAWSPQNSKGSQVATPAPGGYQYDATRIRGFSLTHLSGVGCSGANGDIPIMPHVGEVTSSPSADTKDEVYASTFSHRNEKAAAGYYKVGLDSGASAELTTTARTGSGRFGFPGDKPASMLFRTSNSETGSTGSQVKVDAGRRTVTGSVDAGNFCGPQSANNRKALYTLHFTVRFDRPFASSGTWQDEKLRPGTDAARGGTGFDENGKPVAGKGSGAYVTFPEGTRQVRARVAISYVSAAGAEANLRAENPSSRSFGAVRSAAREQWRRALGRVQVGGGTREQRTTFYTALYHAMLEPTLTSDAGGRYRGADGRTHRLTKGQHAQYDTFSGWDQYRSQVQLLALLQPKAASDYAQSLFHYARQRGGEWDRWLLQHGKTSVMSGDPSAPALAGMYAFGARDFDVKGALSSLVHEATVPTANDSSDAGCNVECVGQRPSLDKYLANGYVPADDCHCWGGAAETLEDSAADFALAELAGETGDFATRRTFLKRAGNWTKVFDPHATPEGGYMRDRKADGSWAGASFDPATEQGFVEGTSARYSWMVYSDVAGLAQAMGGRQRAVERLDAFFRTPDGAFDFSAEDPTRYDPTNEPDINAPYLYDYLGAPYKTQETVRAELDQLWTTGPGGIPGNDDAGTMSAWYVFSALGMYPQVPSRADLVLSSPVFPRAVVHTGGGKKITVRAPGASRENIYIHGVEVNGRSSDRPWVPASFVERGGTLDYTLGSGPDTSWGSDPQDAPPSFRTGESPFFAGAVPDQVKAEPGTSVRAALEVSTLRDRRVPVRWSAKPPEGIRVSPSRGALTVPKRGSADAKLSVTAAAGTQPGLYRVPLTVSSAQGGTVPKAWLSVTVGQRGTLSWLVNNTGISADDTEPTGNFDGGGWSYSAKALAEAGAVPGGKVTAGGFDFNWPQVKAGSPDNVQVGGGDQVLDLSAGSAGATRLGLLGSAASGPSSGSLTLTYADGSTEKAEFGFSDWTLGGGSEEPSYGNVKAVHTPYRTVEGGTTEPVDTYVFATAPIPLRPGAHLVSVTLPESTQGGDLHVFAVATS